jgi:NAD+--asparagine ADP-ribosyltransferase
MMEPTVRAFPVPTPSESYLENYYKDKIPENRKYVEKMSSKRYKGDLIDLGVKPGEPKAVTHEKLLRSKNKANGSDLAKHDGATKSEISSTVKRSTFYDNGENNIHPRYGINSSYYYDSTQLVSDGSLPLVLKEKPYSERDSTWGNWVWSK